MHALDASGMGVWRACMLVLPVSCCTLYGARVQDEVDEDGEPVLDENGEPVKKQKRVVVRSADAPRRLHVVVVHRRGYLYGAMPGKARHV